MASGWLDSPSALKGWTVVALAVLLWSAATTACGLAGSFAAMFATRMLVGIGEAALTPGAVSMIGDLFPPQKRAFPMGVFVMAGSIGAGLAMVLGVSLIAWLESLPVTVLPFVGDPPTAVLPG